MTYKAEQSFLKADFPDTEMYDLTVHLTDDKKYTIEHTAKSVSQWGICRCAMEMVRADVRIANEYPTVAEADKMLRRWLGIYG